MISNSYYLEIIIPHIKRVVSISTSYTQECTEALDPSQESSVKNNKESLRNDDHLWRKSPSHCPKTKMKSQKRKGVGYPKVPHATNYALL
jgi:hypothetical protein